MDNKKRFTSNTTGESKTQQNFANDADINTIVNRHMRGIGRNLSNIGAGGTRQPIFGDFTSIDYHNMLNVVQDVNSQFMSVRASVRKRFNNDPYQLIRWVEDPANMREAVKLGLLALPEGYAMTEQGELVHQLDIEKEAAKAPSPPPPQETPPAAKADDEAQPKFNGGKK